MTEEIWKDITGYEGLYQVSNLGRVKSLGNKETVKNDHLLKFINHKCGYLQVNLCKNGKSKKFLVHRLVANNFILNPNNYSQVHHIDENKQNNCISNLLWCNNEYNNQYSKGVKIQCLDLITNEISFYPALRAAERQLNIQHSAIRRSIKKQQPCKNRFIFTEINKEKETLT